MDLTLEAMKEPCFIRYALNFEVVLVDGTC
jgi:hypothetical protein